MPRAAGAPHPASQPHATLHKCTDHPAGGTRPETTQNWNQSLHANLHFVSEPKADPGIHRSSPHLLAQVLRQVDPSLHRPRPLVVARRAALGVVDVEEDVQRELPRRGHALHHGAEGVDRRRLGHLDGTPVLPHVLRALGRLALTCGASQGTRTGSEERRRVARPGTGQPSPPSLTVPTTPGAWRHAEHATPSALTRRSRASRTLREGRRGSGRELT
eukprot:7382249-Prymnesium_polylepis.1